MRFLGMIIEHVFLHEAAHALRGHLAYMRRTPAHRALDERRRSLNTYLELDVDLHAVDMWLAITQESDDFPTQRDLLLDLYFQRCSQSCCCTRHSTRGTARFARTRAWTIRRRSTGRCCWRGPCDRPSQKPTSFPMKRHGEEPSNLQVVLKEAPPPSPDTANDSPLSRLAKWLFLL